jgi:pyruvate dehydrogenase E2 component (dihydrolipoamide acetyltransferase)
VAILGIGRIQEKPVVRGEKVVIRRILPLSLSFDHRVVDGAEAARFLNTVIARLEDPDLILLET